MALIRLKSWVQIPPAPRWLAARQGRKRTAKRGNSFWCRSTAGRCPVKAAIGVRIPAPERSCGVTDITPGYGPGEWGFDSLREYASAVSSMEERRSYKPMIGVRLPDCVRWLWCSGSIGGRGPPGPGSVPGDHPKRRYASGQSTATVNRLFRVRGFESLTAHAPVRDCSLRLRSAGAWFDSRRKHSCRVSHWSGRQPAKLP
jgi:hypothetical protein